MFSVWYTANELSSKFDFTINSIEPNDYFAYRPLQTNKSDIASLWRMYIICLIRLQISLYQIIMFMMNAFTSLDEPHKVYF